MKYFTYFFSAFFSVTLAAGTRSPSPRLQTALEKLALETGGRLGICALPLDAEAPTCVNGNQAFSLQSVMKLIVAAAVMDASDRGKIDLAESAVLTPKNISPGPKEFSDLILKNGSVKVTIAELVQRAVVDSDSTSVDFLIDRLGGISAIQDFSKRKSLSGVRIDRDERQLQSESQGLVWRPEYSDLEKFDHALNALPIQKRNAAWSKYLKDPRDTATPQGMVAFLKSLAKGELLSLVSTKKLLDVMSKTKTGPDRLAAGLPAGWRLGHKTGTSPSWNGVVAATNDVGILTAPSGAAIAVAVFLADSKGDSPSRAATIAKAAKTIVEDFEVAKSLR